MVPVTFQVSTDDQGMVILRAVASDGQPVAELSLCPHEAYDVALTLRANASLAALDREQGS